MAGSHKGGYARFSFDITNLVREGENQLVVKVEDSFDMQQPRGKQRWLKDSYQCWYVQTTGIWKSVWTEYVPKISLKKVKMTPVISDGHLELEYQVDAPESMWDGSLSLEAVVTFEGEFINKVCTAIVSEHTCAKIDVTKKNSSYAWIVKTWSPKEPNLYDISFRLIKNLDVMDEIGSYFAMR